MSDSLFFFAFLAAIVAWSSFAGEDTNATLGWAAFGLCALLILCGTVVWVVEQRSKDRR